MAENNKQTERVGFVGIGNMGVPMSRHLKKAGFELTLYDVDSAAAKTCAEELGCQSVTSIKELAAASDIIITMLPTGHIVRQVMLEPAGDALADHLAAGSLLIDMSSSDPSGSKELGTLLAEKNVQFVDAPVSGGVNGAINGTLAIMLGGDDANAIERAKPVLSAMGTRIFETGPLGSGHAMKALNNSVTAAGFAAASEALIVGERFGLKPDVMVDIFNVSTGRNFSTELTIKNEVITGKFASGFALALLSKDVKIAADLALSLEMDMPLLAETNRRWLSALDDLGGDNDHTLAFTSWKNKTTQT